MERIVAAAIQYDGTTISLPRPARHAHVQWCALQGMLDKEQVSYAVQGFLTSEGRFANRIEAKNIAHIAGQELKRVNEGVELFSEDLW